MLSEVFMEEYIIFVSIKSKDIFLHAMRFRPEIIYHFDDLRVKISQGENESQDFKQLISHKEKIARTIAAFANGKGGSILIGVNDKGIPVGCDPEQEMYMIYEAGEFLCQPPVDIDFVLHEENELTILEAKIKMSLKKPHLAKDDHDEWKIYLRDKDKTIHL